MRVAIIGGGLAGCACAYVLKRAGMEPVIYEASDALASGASGNAVGLYNPRFAAQLDANAQFYSAAFFEALAVFEAVGAEIGWDSCGALHLITDEKKARRFSKMLECWGWDSADMQLLGASEASGVAGIEIAQDALYLPRSGTVSPKKICEVYARGVDVHFGEAITNPAVLRADSIILACGMGVRAFDACKDLPLRSVRGQVSYISVSDRSAALRCTLGYGGYIAPAKAGVHCLGSTFQPWLNHDEIIAQDDLDNLARLFEAVPSLAGDYEVVDRRAGVRCASKDHFPVIGQVGENMYVSTAHGSHGILSSLMGAMVICDLITGRNNNELRDFLKVLSPARFTGC